MLFFQAVPAQSLSELDALIEQRKPVFDGKMSVAVWKDTLIYSKVVGEEMNTNTQVPLGSQGTLLTAVLTMTFVDQGKLSLDDPVAKYLPVFAKYAKSYLTIRHCLANVTGIAPEKGGIEKFFQRSKFETLEAQVDAFASSRDIQKNPGQLFDYNNIGTNIVGRVLEVVGKKSFDRLMMDRVFRPLGMRRSSYSAEYAVNPFSGGVTTAADYIKVLTMLLRKGMAPNGKQILSEKSVAELFKIQTGQAATGFVPKGLEGYHYGLGIWIQPDGNGIFVCPGIKGGFACLNTNKSYAVAILGTPKERKDKEEKSNAVYREIISLLEERL